jgi:hypothetical protein
MFNQSEVKSLDRGIQAVAGATADLRADRIREDLSDHANLLLAIRHFGIDRFEGYMKSSLNVNDLVKKLDCRVEHLNFLIQPTEQIDEEQAQMMEAAWNRDVNKWRAVGGNVD